MKKLYMLVGVPASGKSTWIARQKWLGHAEIVSTDIFIEQRAREANSTYSAVFNEYISTAVNLMLDQLNIACAQGKDIVWDQTNLCADDRRKKLQMLPDYYSIAVVFSIPDNLEHVRRLQSRPGKIIPAQVVESMKAKFKIPCIEEGFNEVWYT